VHKFEMTRNQEMTSTDSPIAPGRGLRRDALGLPALIFSVATAAAPLTALMLNVPVIVVGAGWAAPAAFAVAALMLAVFSVGYVAMSGRVRSAGGMYAFVSQGLGRTAGLGAAAVVTMAYAVLTAAIIGAFGYFASVTVEDWTGVHIPVWTLLFGALAVSLLFAWFEVRITARVLGVFFVAELAVLVVFAVAVLAQGGEAGLSAAPLDPLALVENGAAVAAFGAAAPGLALFGALWSWTGFEMAPSYGEETRRRPGIMAAAMLGTLAVLAIVYVLVSYAFVVGYGTEGVAAGVGAQFDGEVASAYFPLTDRYGGAALTTAFEALIVTSLFACQLAFFNTAARYLFALGREGVLPRALARTHGRQQTPHVASIALAIALALYIGAFQLDDASRDAALLKLATWSPLLGVFGLLAVQALCSLAIVAYFRRRGGGNPWTTQVAPLAGAALMAFAAYLLLVNRGALAAAEGVPFVQAIPWTVLAVFATGAVAALWLRIRDAARYQTIGRVALDEA
jgi:amino acid transporter